MGTSFGWESKVPSTAGVTVLARLPEAPFMSEPPSLTSSAACYRAVFEAWSTYADLTLLIVFIPENSIYVTQLMRIK
jgi:hypothetical protein